MKYQEWKLIAESIGSGVTLGLSRPNVVGGPIGSHFSSEKCDDDRDEDENKDEDEDEDEDSNFPPDDSEEMYDDSEDDSDKEFMDDESEEGEEDSMKHKNHNDDDSCDMDMSYMDDEEGPEAPHGDVKGKDKEGDNMDFLNDIDPALMGDEDSDIPADQGHDDMGDDHGDMGDDHDDLGDMGDDLGMDGEVPGDDAPIDAEPVDGDDNDAEHEDTMKLMNMMAAYCNKYMKAESKKEDGEDPEVVPVKKDEEGKKKCGAWMKKDAKKAKKEEKCDSCEKEKKHCHCEGDSFANSLAKNMSSKKPVTEDALVSDPAASSTESGPGSVGFAPQGRIGSIGGGYTKDDFAEIPVLGESYRLPTLKEWIAMKKLRK